MAGKGHIGHSLIVQCLRVSYRQPTFHMSDGVFLGITKGPHMLAAILLVPC